MLGVFVLGVHKDRDAGGAAWAMHLASDFSALVDVGVDPGVVGAGADGVLGLGVQDDDICIRPRSKRALPGECLKAFATAVLVTPTKAEGVMIPA